MLLSVGSACPAGFKSCKFTLDIDQEHVAVSINWGVPFLGALIVRALLFGVYMKALGFCKLAH